MVVGVIFVYQMMAADIRNMLPEYATVKALGYRPPYLTGVVLWQAMLLALLGYVPGFVAALGLYSRRDELRRHPDRDDARDRGRRARPDVRNVPGVRVAGGAEGPHRGPGRPVLTRRSAADAPMQTEKSTSPRSLALLDR